MSMSLWELRQIMESAVPWWTPFAAAGVGLLTLIALMIKDRFCK